MSEATNTSPPSAAVPCRPWWRVASLALVVIAVGLPINHLFGYAIVLVAAVLIFSGRLARRPRAWLLAVIAVLIAASAPRLLLPTPIAEGDNIFLPAEAGNVLEQGLPDDVHRFMRSEFDALYPPAVRCAPASTGCWISQGLPDRLYAFAADGALQHPAFSRNVTSIDFSDPVWLRLGFVNDLIYNWYTDAPDVHRMDRNRAFYMGLRRWNVTMPWFAMFQFPADYVGGSFVRRGAR